MIKTISAIAFVGATALLSTLSLAAEPQKQTVTVRAGQGDVVTISVPTQPERSTSPYALTGRNDQKKVTPIKMRTGQGNFVQIPR